MNEKTYPVTQGPNPDLSSATQRVKEDAVCHFFVIGLIKVEYQLEKSLRSFFHKALVEKSLCPDVTGLWKFTGFKNCKETPLY